MSRYLTPSKVGLLALISLYTESVLPSVATVPVLSFIVACLLPISLDVSPADSYSHSRNIVLNIDDLQKATISHGSAIPGRTLWDLLLHKIWKIDSFDALHVFFDTLSFLLQKTLEEQPKAAEDRGAHTLNRMLLSRSSPLGSFVRRAQLEFTRLPFHDGVVLWKDFVAYRAPTFLQWKKRNPIAGNTIFDSNLREGNLTLGDPLTNVVYNGLKVSRQQQIGISTEDVERLLDYQVDLMQSGLMTLGFDAAGYTLKI